MKNKLFIIFLFIAGITIIASLRLKDIKYIQVRNCPEAPTAHDTHVARCYRCALGQNVEKANEDFCKRNYGIWNLERDQVKDSCK